MIQKPLQHKEAVTPFAQVSLGALSHNVGLIQTQASGCGIVPMVKANAYGHGLLPVTHHLAKHPSVVGFGVATLLEAIQLRDSGIQHPVLLAGGANWLPYAEEVVAYGLTPLISSIEELQLLARCIRRKTLKEPYPVHVDLDTGMSRIGFLAEDPQGRQLQGVRKWLSLHREIKLEGMSTHFAHADAENLEHAQLQLERFIKALVFFAKEKLVPSVVHVANTAAVLAGLTQDLQAVMPQLGIKQQWARSGIGIYGYPSRPAEGFEPVLTLKAPIVCRKQIPVGETVGYGCTYQVQKPMELAIVAMGYAEGYHRVLSNRSDALLAGYRVPLVGRVSMNLLAVDVTQVAGEKGLESCAVGKPITLIGTEGTAKVDAEQLAQWGGTISYEILTSLNESVARYYL